MKILVTGSAGFMGSHIADELTRWGFDLLGIDNLSGGFLRNTQNHKFAMLDLRDRHATEKLVSQFKPNILFALAANARECASFFQPIDVTEANLYAYINVLEPCIKYGLKKVVYFSSMSRYGDQKAPFGEDYPTKPIDVYASNKVAAEEITKQLAGAHNFDWTIVIPRNVFGERQSLKDRFRNFIGITINHILRNEDVVIYGDGLQVRSFSYIKNSLNCYVQCLEEKTNNEIINIGGLVTKTINEVAEIIISNFPEYKGKIIHLHDRYGEVKYAWATFKKSIDLLGYKENYSLEEGTKSMCDWARTIGPQNWTEDKLSLINDKVPITWK